MTAGIGTWGEMGRHLKLLQRDPLRLDDGTADRILHGLSPDDVPRAYRRVAALVRELTAVPTEAELAGERRAVTTLAPRFREVAATSARDRTAALHRRRRFRVVGAVLVGSATLFAGLGAAGALPGAAERVASDVLSTVGVSTPFTAADTHADTHADTRGRSGGAPPDAAATSAHPTTGNGTGASGGASGGKGSTVSQLAQDPSTEGVAKGATVSSEASNGQSQAGEHGSPSSPPAPHVDSPNPGGSGTGDAASGGDSATGTDSADDASGGRSAAGSADTGTGSATKP
jgi:hypothetical protein